MYATTCCTLSRTQTTAVRNIPYPVLPGFVCLFPSQSIITQFSNKILIIMHSSITLVFVDRNLSAEAGNTIPSPLPYSELNNFRLVGSIVMHFPSHFQHIIVVVVKYSNLSDGKFNGRKSILMGIDKCWTYIFGGNPSDVIYHSHPINNCLCPRTVFPNTLVNWTLPLPGCFSLN